MDLKKKFLELSQKYPSLITRKNFTESKIKSNQ